MENARAAAVQHVRVMQTRIEKQTALVERIQATGADAAEQIQRLELLRLALEEMLIHCGRLAPSTNEVAHAGRIAPLPSSHAAKRK
jgi:hypothetical protein